MVTYCLLILQETEVWIHFSGPLREKCLFLEIFLEEKTYNECDKTEDLSKNCKYAERGKFQFV